MSVAVDEFRESIISYLLTRNTPWKDEKEMREAVNTTIGIVFYEARSQTLRILNGDAS